MAGKEDLGTRKKCFTCGEMMECREVTYQGESKPQWQDGNDNKAHFKFNKETEKVV